MQKGERDRVSAERKREIEKENEVLKQQRERKKRRE